MALPQDEIDPWHKLELVAFEPPAIFHSNEGSMTASPLSELLSGITYRKRCNSRRKRRPKFLCVAEIQAHKVTSRISHSSFTLI